MVDVIFVSVLVVVSIYLLVKGADYLIRGAVDIARILNISPLLIGLTIVAFGTGLPEFVLSLIALVQGHDNIALGNIIGSNITNIGLIIGISALVLPLKVRSKTLIYEFPFLLVSTFFFLLLAHDFYIYGQNVAALDRIDGVILLLIFGFFLFYIYRSIKEERRSVQKQFAEALQHKSPVWKDILLVGGGSIALFLGGNLFVRSATELAVNLGLSEAFIGLTIAAIGTSLPELFTSVVAAAQKHPDLAVGNIVGSNIFNILFTVGFISLLRPLSITPSLLVVDGVVMLAFTLLFLVFATNTRKIQRWKGAMLIVFYLLYLLFLFWRMG
ncbi:calcium/sodium antiporter [Candidatus Woesearchaeota archaeon]|nr:calcium/sodium antiporter [Candidatus Woesearchaeota archaeon]